MDKNARKAAAAACKERRAVAAVYALKCGVDGRTWIGETLNVAAQRNQVAFALANGSFLNRELAQAVGRHGGSAFAFEILETLAEPEDGLDAYSRRKWLLERGRCWRQRLQAQTV
jgi:hypothetical protein